MGPVGMLMFTVEGKDSTLNRKHALRMMCPACGDGAFDPRMRLDAENPVRLS